MGMFVLEQAHWSGDSSFQLYCEFDLQLFLLFFPLLCIEPGQESINTRRLCL